ncbi:hypothetical protein [Corynebacterium falsenii]|uniref:hypothetical protein n=1 Tax=Corynebacterium falsenii TaxID=108486 RepID=UPI001C7272C8|nr:hypothetical protein [Corynebacterium falsenii]
MSVKTLLPAHQSGALQPAATYTWFIGAGVAAAVLVGLERLRPSLPRTSPQQKALVNA